MKDEKDKPMRISDLEKKTGISRGTIHYYIREGLVSQPNRTGKTMAYYTEGHIDELIEIKRLRDGGFPVSHIREMKAVTKHRRPAAEHGEASQERRQRIMQKAVEVFARKGYHQTKISDITGAVGVGHSTFYLYFPSKLALFMECVDEVFQAMFSGVWEEIKNEKNPLNRLRKRGEVVLKSYPQFIDILQVLDSTVEDDSRLEAMRKDIYKSIAMTVKRDLSKAMEEGLIPQIDAEIVSYMLVGFLETAYLLMSLDSRYGADDLLDAMVALFSLPAADPLSPSG